MPKNPANTLRELVAIPSVNPMGKTPADEEPFESLLTDYLQNTFESLGLPWYRQTVQPKRDNIIARLEGTPPPDQGGTTLLFEVHQDTVPVDGMTMDPFAAKETNGRLYGRGACDVKGGMAAMLTALERLARERPPDMPTVVLACTVNEEHGFTGVQALTQLWSSPNPTFFQRPPDVAIVAEPTQLCPVVAHKGVVRWKCHTHGRAVHSSNPDLGINAIYAMSRVVQAIEQYQQTVLSAGKEHPLCGRATVSVGTIAGGLSVNTVPAQTTIEIDHRLLPGDDPQQAYQRLKSYIAEQAGGEVTVEHDPPYMIAPGLSDKDNGQWANRLTDIAREVAGRSEPVGAAYGTDASTIAATGVPAVVFGPGSIDQAHTADEWIDLEQLDAASEIYYRFARTLGTNAYSKE